MTDGEGFANVQAELKELRVRRPARLSWLFVVFMVALGCLCVALGFWQLQRLEEKIALIAKVEDRAALPPVPLPPLNQWVALDPQVFDFRSVTLVGEYVEQSTVFVFASLSQPRGKRGGTGYWVISPFALKSGGFIMVNRGFVPAAARDFFADESKGTAAMSGEVTLTGIARVSEQSNAFTPGPDLAAKTEYVRSVDRLRALMSPSLGPFPDFYVDLAATSNDALPQGGETVMRFSNRHFEYALTWFGFAIIDALMLGAWIARNRKPR